MTEPPLRMMELTFGRSPSRRIFPPVISTSPVKAESERMTKEFTLPVPVAFEFPARTIFPLPARFMERVSEVALLNSTVPVSPAPTVIVGASVPAFAVYLSVPPLESVMPDVDASRLTFPMERAPPEMSVAPWNVWSAEMVSVPVPVLVSVLEAPEMMPDQVWEPVRSKETLSA